MDLLFFSRGVENSHIYFDSEAHWRLQSLRYPEKYLRLSRRQSETNYPIGRYNWEASSPGGLCDVGQGQMIPLALSNCYPNKFTCDSGRCIDLSERCDTFITCGDSSDEKDCSYLRFTDGYAKEISPKVISTWKQPNWFFTKSKPRTKKHFRWQKVGNITV